MNRRKDMREAALKASNAYYTHLADYQDFLAQRERRAVESTKRELDFLEFAFRTHATHGVRDVLDVACGNGRHVVGLAHRGYRCTGQDYTPQQVHIAKARAKREGVSVKLLQGDATRLEYESKFDAVLALYILSLLPDDDDVLTCLRQIHRALKSGGIIICNISNPFYNGKDWFSLKTIHEGHYFQEIRVPGMRYVSIDRVQDFDSLHGVAWWQEIHVIEAPDGVHVFHDSERARLFTYWDILHYLQVVGFNEIKCYPDWKVKPPKKPRAEGLVFVSRKN
jgi:SAM-dependent methyltransferase